MSVLVFAESSGGKFNKTAFEATSYGRALANELGTSLAVLSVYMDDVSPLYAYGADKVLKVNNEALNTSDANVYADIIKQAAIKENAETVIISLNANGFYLAPLVAVAMDASYASNVVTTVSTSPFVVKRKVFSNKAFSQVELTSSNKVIGLAKNGYGLHENAVSGTEEIFEPTFITSKINRTAVDKTTGKVTIADADIVVSAGRGLKGPENWGMIEDLAEVLGAATACSKPVADLDWRPHAEHVGQTGKQVASNLYIAIGISGAIQHLAGVNSSKVKVVINTDPEAPFFKAADYGVVGDAFEVVPALVEKLKAFKAQNG
jgi:electron transfer flavoprotein alpha subunit